jgi:3-deoxy-manno-octulosonate cytidylyltransferase (CMP-KDO synthetase)
MPALVVIPARWGSERFPGKPLAQIAGKSLIQHVYENSKGASLASEVMVATDHEGIFEAVAGFGGKVVMTSPDHPTGTDRVAEAASKTDYDIIVNVQGDEPLMRPDVIDSAIKLLEDERASIGTLAARIEDRKDIPDPNVVKVVFDGDGFALYFSRAPIPYHRAEWEGLAVAGTIGGKLYKHIGIYSYRRDVLMKLQAMAPTNLEKTEKLEQLRALENGMKINVGITEYESHGIDTPGDLERVEKWLSSSS